MPDKPVFRPGIMLENLHQKSPLIHNITNYVTANDCANILLACGASPIMADDPLEAADITGLCQGLHLNLGTPSQSRISSMLSAGKRAARLGIPIVFDPVGAGASPFRIRAAGELLKEIRFTVIRGNLSEIRALSRDRQQEKGVDAAPSDKITEENLEQAAAFARQFARQTETIAVITGAIDIVTDGIRTFCIRNGHPMMNRLPEQAASSPLSPARFWLPIPNSRWRQRRQRQPPWGFAGRLPTKGWDLWTEAVPIEPIS